MGWCSGTDVFDPVASYILRVGYLTDDQKVDLLKVTIAALQHHDWDCQSDSAYYSDPLVRKAMLLANPDWAWLQEGYTADESEDA